MTVGELKKALEDYEDDKLVLDFEEDEITEVVEDAYGNVQLFT